MPDVTSLDTPPGSATAALVVVRAAVAPLHGEPRVSSAQTSQALAGHPLLVLEERPDQWLRVVGEDGYDGWMHAGYATAAAPAQLRVELGAVPEVVPGWAVPAGRTACPVRLSLPPTTLAARTSLGCTVVDAAGTPRPLPLGAWTTPSARVVAGQVLAPRERAARFPTAPESIAASAATLFAGTSYQWGGITPWGADCSGFVQTVFGLHGCALPRDAWQQALLGADAGSPIAELRPADLLFFSEREDRRITHVGIALGGSRMAHVALGRGGFAVEQLDGAAEPYVSRLLHNFQGARRVV